MAHVTIATLLKIQGVKRRRKGTTIQLKPSRPSRANELWYKAELLKVARFIRAVVEKELLPVLKSASAGFGGDAIPADVSITLDRLANRFGGIDKTAARLSKKVVRKNLQATDKQLSEHIKSAMGVDISGYLTDDGIRDELRLAEQANIELIKSIPVKYLEKVREKLDKNFEQGGRFTELKDALDDAGEVTESRMKLIGRDQTSKMNGAFNRVRQTSVGIKKYRWQTAGDERVRPTHHDNDGKTFFWDNPPAETGNPGDDICCRCSAISEFDLDEMEAELGEVDLDSL